MHWPIVILDPAAAVSVEHLAFRQENLIVAPDV
jgi:hypothetical protein